MSQTVLPLEPPRRERCAAAIHVDARGHQVADPYAILGLDAEADAEAVRRAWVEKIQEHPPEKDPEGARALREARDRLVEPGRLLERLVGVLHVPDPQAWGLPTDAGLVELETGPGAGMLDAASRIHGQALVYALVEDTFVKVQSGG